MRYNDSLTLPIITLARHVLDAMVRDTRDDGTSFLKLTDGSPEWMKDVIREGHLSAPPNDDDYEACDDVLRAIVDASDGEDVHENGYEYADGATSSGDMDRYRWLSADGDNAGYVDEARKDGLTAPDASIADAIASGWREKEFARFNAIVRALETEAEKRDNDPDLSRHDLGGRSYWVTLTDSPGRMENEYRVASVIDGEPDDTIGSVDEGPGYYAIGRGPIDVDANEVTELGLSADDVAFLKATGGAILHTSNEGFVTATWYDTPAKLDKAWKTITRDDEGYHSSMGEEN